MRVLYLTTWFPGPQDSTAGSFIAREVALLARDHEVRVVHVQLGSSAHRTQAPLTLTFPGIGSTQVPLHRLPFDPRRPWLAAASRREVRALLAGTDLLHTGAFSTLLALAGVRVDRPWVHTEHWSGLTDPAGLSRPLREVVRVSGKALQRPDVVTAVTDYALAGVRRRRSGPSVVVPCVVAPTLPAPRREGARDLRLVAVGGLVPGKNPDLAVEALAELRRDGVDAHLTWVGDGPLREEVADRANRLGVSSNLDLTGRLDAAGVTEQLAAADIFMLPTRRETFCVAAAEAVAAGRPVVIGARGGQREVLPPQVTAWVDVAASGVPRRLARATLELGARTASLSAQEIAATLGDRFSPDTVLSGFRAAYQRAIELRGVS